MPHGFTWISTHHSGEALPEQLYDSGEMGLIPSHGSWIWKKEAQTSVRSRPTFHSLVLLIVRMPNGPFLQRIPELAKTEPLVERPNIQTYVPLINKLQNILWRVSVIFSFV